MDDDGLKKDSLDQRDKIRRKEDHRPRSTTTLEEDINTASQRKISLIWESTQAAVALMVVAASVAVAVGQGFSIVLKEFPPTLSNALFLIVGFYFSRTNHAAIGGAGKKPNESQEYLGR